VISIQLDAGMSHMPVFIFEKIWYNRLVDKNYHDNI